jgi:hypothetical protein
MNNFIKTVKAQIVKRNRVYYLEKRQNKINNIKSRFNNYLHIINKLENYDNLNDLDVKNDLDLINDLDRISYYNPDHYIHPDVELYICNIINKYLDEFHDDKDILEFFVYILVVYKCINDPEKGMFQKHAEGMDYLN